MSSLSHHTSDPRPIPNPDRITCVIDALRVFIDATAWRPGQPAPPEDVARDATDRLECAITELGDFETWEDEPGRLTGAGMVAFYICDIRSVRAEMSADGRSGLYASPLEQGWLNDDLRGLCEGLAAIRRLGAFGSMNPMDNPDPVHCPEVVDLNNLFRATTLWLEISRIEEGQQPIVDYQLRLQIRGACRRLHESLDQVGFDLRWVNMPEFQQLSHVIDTIRNALREMMERACFVWCDGEVTFHGRYYTDDDGIDRCHPSPAYVAHDRARDVEFALSSLRRIVNRFRTEGVPRSPGEIELPLPANTPPAPVVKPTIALTPCQLWVLDTIRGADYRLNRSELISRAKEDRNGSTHSECNIRESAAFLTREGFLTRATIELQDGRGGPGYGLPEWLENQKSPEA